MAQFMCHVLHALSLQAKCVGLMADGARCNIGELPPLDQLRVLRVYQVDDLAAVLAQGTNLRWLELAAAADLPPRMVRPAWQHVPGDDDAAWSSKLQVLTVADCRCLLQDENCAKLLQLLHTMEAPELRWLRLWCWPTIELPPTYVQATHLLHLDLSFSRLQQLPRELGNLVNLRWLDLSDCSSLTRLPHSTTNLRQLEWLELRECSSLTELPPLIGCLERMGTLSLSGCSSLQALPESISQLPRLEMFDLTGCSSISRLPADLGKLPLKYFEYSDLKVDIAPEWIEIWKSSGKCYIGFYRESACILHMAGGQFIYGAHTVT